MTAIAIDDEPIALEIVKAHASKVSFVTLKQTFTNAFEAMAWLQKEKVDLLFLDIKMPDISGMEFVSCLGYQPMVIFTTAYAEHALQSFELDAVDYLLKPFSLSRFTKACNKAYELLTLKSVKQSQSNPEYIFVKNGTGQVRVKLAEIIYIQSAGNYVQLVLTDQKITTRLTMAETEALLPADSFTRIHRSYIVGNRFITRIEREEVYLIDIVLPVGSGFAEKLAKIK